MLRVSDHDATMCQSHLLDSELDNIYAHAPKDPSSDFVASKAVQKIWAKKESGDLNNEKEEEEEGTVKRKPIADDW